MMKDLIIPTLSEATIDMAQIDFSFKGIIIAYKYDKIVGCIQYSDGDWCMLTNIDKDDSDDYSNTLLGLVTSLIANKKCTHFRTMEFSEYES